MFTLDTAYKRTDLLDLCVCVCVNAICFISVASNSFFRLLLITTLV
jgi:hypothetical protein